MVVLVKGNDKITLENENHIAGFKSSGWVELKPEEKPAKEKASRK